MQIDFTLKVSVRKRLAPVVYSSARKNYSPLYKETAQKDNKIPNIYNSKDEVEELKSEY